MFIRTCILTSAAAWLLCLSTLSMAQTQNVPPATTDDPALQLTPAQKAQLTPRRPVTQVVASPLPTVTSGYRPTLTPPSGAPDPVGTLPVRPTPIGAGAPPSAPLPVPVGNCNAGGCTGVDGTHYNTGAAGVTVDAAGRTCRQVGTTMQCN